LMREADIGWLACGYGRRIVATVDTKENQYIIDPRTNKIDE